MTQQIQSDIIKDQLPDGWVETTLGSVIERITKWTTPKSFSSDINDINYIKSESLNYDGSLDKSKIVKISSQVHNELKRSQLKENDILLSMAGIFLGKTGLVTKDLLPANTNQACAIITANPEIVDYIFLWYKLRNQESIKYFNSTPSQSAQPNINFEEIKSLPVFLPPLPEQQAIASVLSSFDNKIELLREQNKTLEQTAQTIFQEWFGKYGVDDELPEGWRVGKLGTEFDISIGRTPPRLEYQRFSKTPTGKKWISIKDIGNAWIYIFDTSEYLTDEAIKKFNIPVIPANTTILSFKMTVGKLTITTEEMLSNEAIAHLKIKDGSQLSTEFIYCYLQNLDFNSLGSTSSIVTAINSTIIKELELVIPNDEQLKKFDDTIKPIFEKIFTNSLQIKSLSETRDELLPRLMKGEVRVKI
ncbi:MAG: hypothetical protein ACD_80C00226G0008 [uncultured bacterium (gcode 4)]|uniref:Type I restriction modification DNA specificity domain-containing protein n=1 Tax=uncultured bacterium (gcode 4) TaxID=1234023 RepID=K1X363_9BACT|nr:MAG: hypothetical protein ACD_80C00226G0008 [uncultured bacterium (gcode 4)]